MPRRAYLEARKSDGKVLGEKPISGNWGCVTGTVDAAFARSGSAAAPLSSSPGP